ncbi:hypothetical protein A9993_12210 [Rahnella victoriana]|uniref:Spy/CpxP family protein refolding chaperone n=1 Tax=Rahnella victoriana TaxID=1510570 RepID=UPI000BCF9607|nr:Spy/CpxP family protein refolding chaperone [Rahnella victoriana]PBI80445.1 hypothetical protein A9993_12210 [Rahnella victoriana]
MKTFLTTTLMAMTLSFSAMTSASVDSLPQDSVIQQLKLTPEQIEKVKALRQDSQKALSEIDIDAVKKDAIIDMFRSGEWSDRVAKKQLDAIGDIQNQVRFERVKFLFNINQVLTVEQKQQLQKMIIEKNMY